jgi:hypothetical protein
MYGNLNGCKQIPVFWKIYWETSEIMKLALGIIGNDAVAVGE